jgi:nucleotide-binding universal stress UspA family protein
MYRTVLVHLNTRPESANRLRFGIDIARRFDAALIGMTAGLPQLPPEAYAASTGGVMLGIYEAYDRTQIEADFSRTEEAFKTITANAGLETDWRAEFDVPWEALIRNATSADIVVAGPGARAKLGDIDTAPAGDVVLRTGRPTLVVPPQLDRLPAEPATVIAWKETPEARRALADALPFLKLSRSVVLFHVQESSDREGDVRLPEMFLMRHGIAVTSHIVQRTGEGVEVQLLAFARKTKADLIVAGAYGHSRFREWVFGGVTNGLLTDAPIACLLSH